MGNNVGVAARNFVKKYGPATSSAKDICNRWLASRRVDDFLGTEIFAGVLVADLLTGGASMDDLPVDIQKAFKLVIDSSADSYAEIRSGLIERLARGDQAAAGVMRALQGRIGELEFMEAADGKAQMSSDSSQEGWDIAVGSEGARQYVQIKVYQDASDAVQKIREVESKLSSGLISGVDQEAVERIDFAVNSEIYEAVKAKVAAEGLQTNVLDLGASRSDIVERIQDSFDSVNNPVDTFFGELLGGALTSGAVHALVNGYFANRKAKEWNVAIEDTVYSTGISAGGMFASMLTEVVLLRLAGGALGGPFGMVLIAGAGIGTRSVLRRVADRRHFAKRLVGTNEELRALINSLRIYRQAA